PPAPPSSIEREGGTEKVESGAPAGDAKPRGTKAAATSEVATSMTTLEIPFEPPPSGEHLEDLAAKSHAAKRLLQQQQQGKSPPASASFRIAAWTFGDDLAMVFLSDEVVVDYALRWKRELDADRLWINAYTGDVSNYIVSKRLLSEGGYEVNNSLSSMVTYGRPERLEPPMEDRITDGVRSLLPKSFFRK
ncbi:MAG: hypothetical protein JJ992_05690, partial [Planctomycetes bacterium]|nr:hypothetical protein [Planctomycetota bacterium]